MTPISFIKRDGFASVAFDYIRFFAALAVVLGHGVARFFGPYGEVANPTLFEKLFRVLLSGYGSQAVMVFFVLSGMFIGQSVIKQVDAGTFNAKNYFFRRLIRLWLVLIPALILTYLLDTIGLSYFASDGIYQENQVFGSISLASLGTDVFFQNMFFLQTVVGPNLGTNGALWSLANEFWYYVTFPLLYLAIFAKLPVLYRSICFTLAVLVLYFVGTSIAALFSIWLFGVFLLYLPKADFFARHYRKTLVVASLVFLLTLLFIRLSSQFEHKLIEQLVCGVSFSVFCYALMCSERNLATSPKHEKLSFELAGFSYTLYLIHTPLLCMGRAILIDSESYWRLDYNHAAVFMALIAAILLVSYALAKVTEFQTHKIYKRFRL